MTPNQNVKDVLKTLADLATTADDVLADRKVTFMEAFKFVPILMGIPALLPKLKPAEQELLTADNASKADIIAYAEDNFDLTNENAEGLLEDVTALFVHGASIINRFIKK